MLKRKIENFAKASDLLSRTLSTPVVDERDLAGIVTCFEMAYELAWTTVKDRFADVLNSIKVPRADATAGVRALRVACA